MSTTLQAIVHATAVLLAFAVLDASLAEGPQSRPSAAQKKSDKPATPHTSPEPRASENKKLFDPTPQRPSAKQTRAKTLSNLYAQLATAMTSRDATRISNRIEQIWAKSGSDTVALLLHRANKAFAKERPGLALKFLDVIVELAPDFSEGWNRRAIAHYMRDDFARALGDLRRTLALDPNHYKALEGLAQILSEVGQKKGALEAYRQLQRVHPFWPQIKENIRRLEREVEGQGI